LLLSCYHCQKLTHFPARFSLVFYDDFQFWQCEREQPLRVKKFDVEASFCREIRCVAEQEPPAVGGDAADFFRCRCESQQLVEPFFE